MCPDDPCSFANSHELVTTSLHLRLTVDFRERRLRGGAELRLRRLSADCRRLVLDTRGLDVTGVTLLETGAPLEWRLATENQHAAYGTPLHVQLPPAVPEEEVGVSVQYQTRPESTALAWMEPTQTAGKQHPYVYSHCEAIHCRAMAPVQDTPAVKFPYTAEVTAPAPLTALMSGLRQPSQEGDGAEVFRFRQPVSVPAYLIALAVGQLESRKLGPRCAVWSEPSVVDAAADEFEDTEMMLKTAEEICGPYLWGVYDLLVLPPSFPLGGTENPCLTFITPTLLAGDRSLVGVVAHEISHSWTGNLVTNRSWEHFWLNEGFTVFLERKIKARLHGEPARHFSAMGGWKSLKETIATRGADDPLTCLSPKLAGVDPDDAFSTVPYEKGHTFLWYLEELVGGPVRFDPFLRAYVEKFAHESITTSDFRSFLEQFFAAETAAGLFDKVDWQAWLHTPGMPPYQPRWDDTLARACTLLAARWLQWDVSQPCPLTTTDLDQLSGSQVVELLAQLLEAPPLPLVKLRKMEELYIMGTRRNAEIRYRWLRLCIAGRWEEQVEAALQFVTDVGRMKFVRPIYRDLGGWPEVRQRAVATYRRNTPNMMHVAVYTVAQDLKL